MPGSAPRWLSRWAALALLGSALPALGADLSGRVFHDRDGDGVPGPGEEGLPAALEVYGVADSGPILDLNAATAPDGSFFLGPGEVEDGCYATRVTLPEGFRLGLPRADCPAIPLPHPVRTRRYSSPRHLVDALRSGMLLHIALGDSIAEPASGCILPRDNTDYVRWLGQRLGCVGPGAVTENEAIGGRRTRHLLEPAGTCGPPNVPVLDDPDDRCDNVLDTIARNPHLVSISIGGNDWLGDEPADQSEPFDPAEVRASVDALAATRANLQEILAALRSELPAADVVVNTVYDNRAHACASTDFHNIWIPIWMRMMREVVWGQGERFHVAEVYPEYAHQDLNGGSCCGERSAICLPGIDGIHPDRDGARMHLEKVWDAVGGVSLGPRDGIGSSSIPDVYFPALELVTVRFPASHDDRAGNAADPGAALVEIDGRGARVPSAGAELVLAGFDAEPAGIVLSRVVAAVRYRAPGPLPVADAPDGHWIEASVDGAFAPPDASVTGWDTVTPIVGAGASAPAPNALPAVDSFREVRASLTGNLLDDGRAAGRYDFSPLTWSDVATLALRLRTAAESAPDWGREVEWDAAWIEVYGTRVPGPNGVYRAPVAAGLVVSPNLVARVAAGPFDDLARPGPVLYFAVDDGTGSPAALRMVKRPGGVARIFW